MKQYLQFIDFLHIETAFKKNFLGPLIETEAQSVIIYSQHLLHSKQDFSITFYFIED